MNIAQAKRIPIRDLLEWLGHVPARERHGELWYVSPFRQETEPSFKLSRDGNAWYDHGAGMGGNILDFAMAFFQTDVSGALQELDRLQGGAPALASSPVRRGKPEVASPLSLPSEQSETITVTSIGPLHSRALQHYLQTRAIPPHVASDYLQEMHYERNGTAYFALAFTNESGGYELRNPYFKGTHGAKDITLEKPEHEECHSVAVFEGFMDFLSAVVIANRPPQMPVIIMNSVAMKERVIEAIGEMGVKSVYLYLDRDKAGRRLTAELRDSLRDCCVQDLSARYEGYKDMNEWLLAGSKQQQMVGTSSRY
ncbi:MAG: toprim domain-containing protein [Caldilineaceae bacterium]